MLQLKKIKYSFIVREKDNTYFYFLKGEFIEISCFSFLNSEESLNFFVRRRLLEYDHSIYWFNCSIFHNQKTDTFDPLVSALLGHGNYCFPIMACRTFLVSLDAFFFFRTGHIHWFTCCSSWPFFKSLGSCRVLARF